MIAKVSAFFDPACLPYFPAWNSESSCRSASATISSQSNLSLLIPGSKACLSSGCITLWWENGILPPLPPDGCECEVALTVARTFGVAEGGVKQRRSHVGKGEGSFCSCARFPFIIIPFHPILTTHVFFYIATLVFFLLSILHLLFCIFLCPFYIKISMRYHENPFALRK